MCEQVDPQIGDRKEGVGVAVKVNVDVLRARADIDRVRDRWIALHAHPNSDIDFYVESMVVLPGFLRPHVIVVSRDGCPETILVGRLEDTDVHVRLGYWSLLRVKVRSLTFVYGGVLGHLTRESGELLARSVRHALEAKEADVAFFNHLRADCSLVGAVAESTKWARRDYFPNLQKHRVMAVPKSSGKFWLGLSSKVRKNQRWQAKKLLQKYCGRVKIVRFCLPSELDSMVRDVEEVAKTTYQRGLRVGFVENSGMRQRLATLAKKGSLRGYILYLGDEPAAFWLGTVYQRTFHSDFMGYDPRFGKYSPGMYLVIRVLEEFFMRNEDDMVETVDFGLGDAQYKEILGKDSWQDISFYVFGITLRSCTLIALRTPIMFLDRVGRRLLEWTNLFGAIKKLWRRKARNREGAGKELSPPESA